MCATLLTSRFLQYRNQLDRLHILVKVFYSCLTNRKVSTPTLMVRFHRGPFIISIAMYVLVVFSTVTLALATGIFSTSPTTVGSTPCNAL